MISPLTTHKRRIAIRFVFVLFASLMLAYALNPQLIVAARKLVTTPHAYEAFRQQVDSWRSAISSFAPKRTHSLNLPAPSLAAPVPAHLAPAAPFATITVNTLADENNVGADCSLREAITAANNNAAFGGCTAGSGTDTITFSVTGTITLSGSALPNISSNMFITGPGATSLTISGASSFRPFTINTGSTVTISGLTVTNGFHATQSGGVENNGTLTMTGCVLTNNRANQGAGIQNNSVLTMTDCAITNNSGPIGGAGDGGGLASYGTSDTLTNCTISGNEVFGNGGGISISNGTLQMTNCTVTNNQAKTGGVGGGLSMGGTSNNVLLKNTIIIGNTGNGGSNEIYLNSGGTVNGASVNNLIGSSGTGGLINGTNSNQVGITLANALLSTLGNYGGTTPTIALLPGSPAISAATSTGAPTTDQRGVTRTGLFDIGAFESQGFTLTITGGDSQSTAINTVFTSPLTVTITASDMLEPFNGGRVNFTPVASGGGASCSVTTSPATISGGSASSGTVTANSIAGAYTVSASANGAIPATFNLTNTAPPAQFNLSGTSTNFSENIGTVFFTVQRANTGAAVSVDYATGGGTATAGACAPGVDYVAASGTLSFGATETSKTFTVTICNDTVYEANQTFNVTLSNPVGGTIGMLGTQIATINNDDAAPTISVNDVTQAEGNSGTTNFQTTITVSGASELSSGFNFQTANGTATAATDYTAIITSAVALPALVNNTTSTFNLTLLGVNGDTTPEPDETVLLNGSVCTDCTFADNQGIATILNDDCPTSFMVNDLGDAADATPGDNLCATSGGVCTLRAAIQEANAITACSPLTINFSVTGTIDLNSVLPILNHPNLTISGPGVSQLTVRRNAGGNYRIFEVNTARTVAINGLTIQEGNSPTGGGILNGGMLTLMGVIVTNNTSTGSGGGIYNLGTLTLNGVAITHNTVTEGIGGGIYSNNGSLTITNSTISNNNNNGGNSSTTIGGGIYASLGTVTISGSTISGNANSNPLSILQGAALNLQDTTTTITNSTISGHTGTNNRNVLYNLSGSNNSTMTLVNVTVTANHAANTATVDTAGGSFPATTYLRNTLVADNTGRPNFRILSATLTSLGNNLDSDGSSNFTNGANGDLVGTSGNKINPLLALLGNYGGTTLTHALLPGSPAINAGNNCVLTQSCASNNLSANLTTDQRGITRNVGNVDIGAYESSNSFALTLVGGTPQSTTVNTAFATALQVNLKEGATNLPGAVITFSGPGSGASINPASGTATTDANGNASRAVTANTTAGGPYTVGATTGGLTAVNFSLTNTCPTITLNSPTVPTGTAGTAFGPVSFTQMGGNGSITWSVSSNNLPAGLMLDSSTGVLNGTPTVATGVNVTIRATDSGGCFGERIVTIQINCPTITLTPFTGTTTTLTTGVVGQSYNQTFTAAPAGGVYTYSIPLVVIPPGLMFDTSTGVLSGIPTTVGTFGFTVTASAFGTCTGQQTYSLPINPVCPSSFTVDHLGDTPDANPGNRVCGDSFGNCTLRAAIEEANAIPACTPLTINFSVTGTIDLGSVLPDLNHPNLTINNGANPSQLTVRRNGAGNFRIFTIASGRTVTINGLTIRDGNMGASGFGGGLYNNNGTLTLNDCVVSNNIAGVTGGGIAHALGTTTINRSTIADNTLESGTSTIVNGAGMYINQGTVTLNATTFSGNRKNDAFPTSIQGAALVLNNATVTATNCTFSNNTGRQVIGNLANSQPNSLSLLNCTIGNNTLNSSGIAFGAIETLGANAVATATTIVKNTIVAGNPGNGTAFRTGATFSTLTSQGNNLCGDATLTPTAGGDLTNTNPLLAALGNYGGLTQTMALLPGSPAINAGTASGAPSNDQRGIARVGNTDIGAYESRGFTLALNGGTPQSTLLNSTFSTPLSVTVTSANSEPVEGGQISFTPPGSGASAALVTNPATIAGGVASVNATANDTGGSYNVAAMANGASPTINFALTNLVPLTVNVPTGVSFVFDATSYTGSQTFQLMAGSNHTLSTNTPQSLSSGTQAVFSNWSDAGAMTHNITVGTSASTITGIFVIQHQLTIAASPLAGGNVTPASGTFYDAGTVVNVTAMPTSGNFFVNWTGEVANTSAAATTVTMDAPKSVTANFSSSPNVVSINRTAATPVCANSSVSWTVIFSSAVSGITASNFALVGGTGASISNVTGAATTWTVTATTGTATAASLGLNMVNSTGITPTVINLPFTGQTYAVSGTPTPASAGSDQTVCGLTATLAGNVPGVGTGVWSLVTGPGTVNFANAGSPTSGVTASVAGVYTFRWTTSNAPCASSADDVVITFTASPTSANAGADQTVCGLTATLAGNVPTVGTGAWTLVTGPGTVNFANANSATSSATASVAGAYTLRWTTSNALCATSTDEVVITFTASPTTANAGADQTVVGLAATLAGNAPSIGIGAWSQVSGPGTVNFGNASSPTSGASASVAGAYTLRWTISNAPCPASTDDVIVTFSTNIATTTTLTSSLNPSLNGQSVTFTATVSAGVGTPTGSVQFKDNGTPIGSPVTAARGSIRAANAVTATSTASISTSALTVGTHNITAEFSGDANFNASTGSLTQTVNPATGTVSGTLTDPLTCTSPGNVLNVSALVSNPANVAQTVSFTATPNANLLALPNSCVASVGTCTVVNATTVTWNGSLPANSSVTLNYQVQVADAAVTGTQLCVTSSATFNGGAPISVTACGSVTCPQAGPGALPNGQNAVSDQKPGSVLVFPIYSSSAASANTQNTRFSITNTSMARTAYVHLFFVDGSSCSVADSYICLTPNQTAAILASDVDPGTTGYIVAVAVNAAGCPINFNNLIGDEFVKLASGHQSNLGAESIAAVAGGLAACNPLTENNAVLAFNNVSYNALPRILASSNIPSRSDGNDTYVVINRIGGNLSTAGSTIGGFFGILYDDAEAAYSFSLAASACQSAGSITNDRPRVVPRFETVVRSGRSGWFKVWGASDIGILGSQINRNTNATTNAAAFNHGHNLHKLTYTTTSTITIPVFPPSC